MIRKGPRGDSRPTIRCLKPLGLSLPPIQQSLEDLVHPLISKAQSTAKACESEPQNQPRIKKINDGSWFKVKVNNWRGGLVLAAPRDVDDEGECSLWWLGLAGKRASDSAQKDFYETLPAQAAEYLPLPMDWKRLEAELASAEVDKTREMVRFSVFRAYATEQMQAYEHASGRRHIGVSVTVKRPDEIYVSVGTRMVADPRWFAVLLAALPEVPSTTWLSEPSAPTDIDPEPGEIVYSALMPQSLLDNLKEEARLNDWDRL